MIIQSQCRFLDDTIWTLVVILALFFFFFYVTLAPWIKNVRYPWSALRKWRLRLNILSECASGWYDLLPTLFGRQLKYPFVATVPLSRWRAAQTALTVLKKDENDYSPSSPGYKWTNEIAGVYYTGDYQHAHASETRCTIKRIVNSLIGVSVVKSDEYWKFYKVSFSSMENCAKNTPRAENERFDFLFHVLLSRCTSAAGNTEFSFSESAQFRAKKLLFYDKSIIN